MKMESLAHHASEDVDATLPVFEMAKCDSPSSSARNAIFKRNR